MKGYVVLINKNMAIGYWGMPTDRLNAYVFSRRCDAEIARRMFTANPCTEGYEPRVARLVGRTIDLHVDRVETA